MAYTSAQLIAAYTAANDGVAPSAAIIAVLNSQATQIQTGQFTDTQALSYAINSADSTTAVAVQAYQFFTGKTPSKAGLDFLVNSAANPTDLNDPYYAQFNIENRYINFAANLGLLGEGAAAFKSTYGGLNFATYVGTLYETIIGSGRAQTAGINVANAVADIIGRQAAFTQTARDRGLITANSTAEQIDIATKAAVVGYLLVEGIKADVGLYAAGSNNFVNALINGNPQYNVDLLSVYSTLGGGTGSPVILPIIPVNLTVGADTFNGTPGDEAVTGIVYSDSGVAPFVTTFSGIDNLNGGGGTDTLNLQVTKSNGGATGSLSLPLVNVNAFEIINIRALSSNPGDIVNLSAADFGGATAFNSDRSTSTVSIANLVTGTTAGVIGSAGVTSGDLIFGYALPVDAATLNLSSGANPANVNILSAPTVVTVNSNGSVANSIGTLRLGGLASTVTINAQADLFLGTITGLAGANVTITVGGSAQNSAAGVAPGVTLGTLAVNVGLVNASALTATGIGATIGANPALNLVGGAGADLIRVGAGQGAAITGTINGGAGTSDVIAFTTGADLAASSATKFTNFETVSVANLGAALTLQAYDVSLLGGINNYWIGGVGSASTGSVELDNLPAASTVIAYSNVAGTNVAGGLVLHLANAGGAADAVTLQLDNFNTKAAANVSGISISSLALGGTATAGQIETLNIVSAGTITGTGTPNTVTLADSGLGPNFPDPNTIKVTGSAALALTTGALNHALTVDASAATGGINFSSLAGTVGVPAALNVNGTAVDDTITLGGKQIGTVLGGGGGDLIAIGFANQPVTIAYKAATDSLLDLAGSSGLGGTGAMDRITGFATGLDKIRLIDLGPAFNSPQIIVDRGEVTTPAEVVSLLSNPTFFMDATNTLRKVVQFDYLGGTMLVADANVNGVYDAGDLAVYLVGVTNVANSDLVGS